MGGTTPPTDSGSIQVSSLPVSNWTYGSRRKTIISKKDPVRPAHWLTWYDTPFTVIVAEYKRSCTLVKPKPVESDPLDTETGYVLAGARLSSVAAED